MKIRVRICQSVFVADVCYTGPYVAGQRFFGLGFEESEVVLFVGEDLGHCEEIQSYFDLTSDEIQYFFGRKDIVRYSECRCDVLRPFCRVVPPMAK